MTEMRHSPLDGLDRNLPALAGELSALCASFFLRASGAVGRAAIVDGASSQVVSLDNAEARQDLKFLIRHRSGPRFGDEKNVSVTRSFQSGEE